MEIKDWQNVLKLGLKKIPVYLLNEEDTKKILL